jgi:hypothetical protein
MGTWLVRRPCAPCLATPAAMVRNDTKILVECGSESSLSGVVMRGSTSLGESPDLSGCLADPKEMDTIYNSKDVCPLASCTPLMQNTFDQGSMGPGTDGDVQGFHDSMCGPMCVCICVRACALCACAWPACWPTCERAARERGCCASECLRTSLVLTHTHHSAFMGVEGTKAWTSLY